VPDRFDQLWRKIDRAKAHIDELERALIEYRDSEPLRVVTEEDPEPGFLRARVDGEPRPIPDAVSVILGDAAHNLRSSLDHFVWAAAVNPTNDSGFPIQRQPNPSNWKGLVFGKLKGCSKALRQAVLATESHPGGATEFLWTLNELDVTDKHRLLLTVGTSYSSFTMDFMAGVRADPNEPDWVRNAPAMPVSMVPTDRYPIEKDQVLLRGPADMLRPMGKAGFAFEPAFGEPDTVRSEPVLPGIRQLNGEVEDLLLRLIPLA
jgi:hypothetical protein